MEHEIAKTIIEQFGGGFCFMVGAKNVIAHPNGVSFKFSASRRCNYCQVALNSLDLYDVKFGRLRGSRLVVTKTFENIYGDQLAEVFRGYTGLETRFPTFANI